MAAKEAGMVGVARAVVKVEAVMEVADWEVA